MTGRHFGQTVVALAALTLFGGCNLKLQPKADPFYDLVLHTERHHEAALFAQGSNFLDQGYFAQATPFFAELTRRYPENATYWQRLGRCLLEQRQFTRAADAYETAHRLRPSLESALGRASALLLSGDLDAARSRIGEIERDFSHSAALARLKGDLAFFEGNIPEAAKSYQQSLEMDPNQGSIQERLQDLQDFLTSHQ